MRNFETLLAAVDELALRFAARADAHDRTGTFAQENAADMRAAGLAAALVPVEFGGDGLNLPQMTELLAHLGRGDASTALGLAMHFHVTGQLAEQRVYQPEALKRLFAACVERGALVNSVASEPELGSPSRGGLPATVAMPVDGGFRITGRKSWVTYAPALDYFLTTATLTLPGSDPVIGVFAVAGGSPGLSLIDNWGDSLSLRASGSCDVDYKDVFVPAEWHVETRVPGQVRRGALPPAWSTCAFAAVYLGVGEAALNSIARYATQRVPTALGKPISSLPHIQRNIGQMDVSLRAARAVLLNAANRWAAEPDSRAVMDADLAAAKQLCTNAAISATDLALRTAGAAGLDRRLPLERYLRDARAGLMHPPQDEAAFELLGRAAIARNTPPAAAPAG